MRACIGMSSVLHDMSCLPGHSVLWQDLRTPMEQWTSDAASSPIQLHTSQNHAHPIVRPLEYKMSQSHLSRVLCSRPSRKLFSLPAPRPIVRRRLKRRRETGANVLLSKTTVGSGLILRESSSMPYFCGTSRVNPHPYYVGSSISITRTHISKAQSLITSLSISACEGLHGRLRRGCIARWPVPDSRPICILGDFGCAC